MSLILIWIRCNTVGMMPTDKNQSLADLAAQVYEETKSGNKVAQRLDVSHTTAYRLLTLAGVSLPDRHGREVNNRKKLLAGDASKSVAIDYAAGVPMKALMERYSVGAWAIKTAVRDNGVDLRNKGAQQRAFASQETLEIVNLYNAGWSQAQIAVKYKSSQPKVGRVIRAAGVKTRQRGATGENHGNWKGGVVKGPGGYILRNVGCGQPMADNSGYVMEHRFVMAKLLGRPLHKDETVHHINGDRTDNAPNNLQLRFGKHGKGVAMKCNSCGSRDVTYEALD